MTKKLTEETNFNASVTTTDGEGQKTASITTDDFNELARFLELAGVKAQGNTISSLSPCCGEGWADDNPVNMDASGFETGGDTAEIEVEIPEEFTEANETYDPDEIKTCPECYGDGYLIYTGDMRKKFKCQACHGTGQVYASEVDEQIDDVQVQHDYGHDDAQMMPYSLDVHDYKGRPEADINSKNFRRVNTYGDNPLRTNEDANDGYVLHNDTRSEMPSNFVEEIEHEFGNTVSHQAQAILDGEPLENQSLNALKLIANYARDKGYMYIWEDISEFFESQDIAFPLESISEQINRLTHLAGIRSLSEYNTDVGDIEIGQYVKIEPGVGGGYGQVVDFSPSGEYAIVDIVGEGEYDIDDEAGMPNLTDERMHYHLSDLLPIGSYDDMVDMIDKDKGMKTEGYTTRELTDYDRDWLSREIPGLEGPWRNRADGKYYYYDPKEGRYYDSTTDTYMDKDFVLEGAGGRYDNKKEDDMIRTLDRKKDDRDRSRKFTPMDSKEPEDEYSAMARKYGVKEGLTVEELEIRLAKEFDSFLNEASSCKKNEKVKKKAKVKRSSK